MHNHPAKVAGNVLPILNGLYLAGGYFRLPQQKKITRRKITHVSPGYITQWWFDVLNRKTAHKIKLSVGARLGQSDFSVKDSAYAYDGLGMHGAVVVAGLHYMNDPASPKRYRVALLWWWWLAFRWCQ